MELKQQSRNNIADRQFADGAEYKHKRKTTATQQQWQLIDAEFEVNSSKRQQQQPHQQQHKRTEIQSVADKRKRWKKCRCLSARLGLLVRTSECVLEEMALMR